MRFESAVYNEYHRHHTECERINASVQCAFKLKYRPQHINNNLLCIANPQPTTQTQTHTRIDRIYNNNNNVKYMRTQKKTKHQPLDL